uniref:Helicase ATP-binding domain-containing protein n=1 Tax=viral metagenome TaxID=1070528 RepID=A0A6C0AQZ1_9ZZZZ
MSEFQPINIADSEEEIIVIKKTKKVKSTLKGLTKKVELIIEDEEKSVFINQVFRKDILANMLANTKLTGKELFDVIIKENKELYDERRQGLIFETLCQILIILKCIENINYTEIYDGQLQNLKQIKNINSLLNVKVDGGGNNIIDMAIKQRTTLVLFTIKYKNKYSETDVSKIDNTITKQNITDDYKIGLVLKDKEVVIKHKYKNKLNIDKQIHDKIIENGLLFDEKDIIKALDVFCQRFTNVLSIDEFIDFINAEYLLSPRQQLTKKLHQKMTEIKFEKSFLTNKHKMWCIAHKPRSGKSITMLLICKYLLEHGYKKILIMTSVPATINSFMNDLEKYIDFKNINYKLQEEFDTIDETFNGIVFCSVQYLKKDGKSKKKDLLKKMGFDAIITDEAHQGSSTDKTKTEILDVDSDVEEIRKNIKLNIFASGTADKTKKYYGINSSCIYEWEIEDEAFMKELIKPALKNREDIINYMVSRHGNTFTECLENGTLNKDYSKHPTQVLMKHSINELLITEIKEYNDKYGTNFGYNCGSLFALKQIINEKGEVEYAEEFELCKTTDGIDILKGLFDCIISTNRMRKTIMKQIENTQTSRGSRKSTIEKPLLFIMYLPTHTRNNTISLLQKTFKQFLETHNLWSDYSIEYSNSTEDTGNVKEEYNEYIQTIMNKTKTENKKGCILLLGNKGSVGITYTDCDATISLDDGHNLDNQKQRFSRALTEADGKTIGINVDMNIQRTYLYLVDIIQKHRRNTKTSKTNAEILYYLFEHNIFLFDPEQINNGKLTTIEIMSYYQKEAENIMKEIDDTPFLENLICDDDMRDFIKIDFQKRELKKINKDLEGEQQDCPKGDKTKVQIDAPHDIDNAKEEENKLNEEETAKIELLINQTYEMCKSFLFPLLALISMSYKLFDFKEIFTSEKTGRLIISLLKDKKIELNKDNYIIIVNIMNNIIDNNAEIVNNIREIYSIAPAKKLRELIEKHFKPTNDEKKQNAEVSTPLKLVNDMLDSTPLEFWKKPQKVFEPCCGKGNFVLGIFDRFYEGLEEMYPDKIERCRVIMTECIYYADLTALNVFITTEIMKCHVQSYCGLDELDFEFNNYTGDSLELNIKDKWNIDGFNKIDGNPPYNSSGDTATGNTIWQDFTKKSLNEWLLPNGYLLFVHPPGWRKPNTERGKFTKMFDLMTKQNQMLYLEIHGIKDGQKVFSCGTRYDWYLIEKTNQYKNTIIIDESGTHNEINLSELSWLPNSNILEINKILAKNNSERCPIIQSMSAYEPRKKWMSSTQTLEFKYPCVHSTPKAGIRYMYSKVNDRGHFGVSKVIFGESGIYKPVIDMEGKYGMTHGAMAIQVDNLEEATFISKVIESDKFDKVIQSCIFSSFRIDWNIFKEFKKDFWKEFI